mmetsp:Transcript_2361/g.3716  ORF Transcript_2361/g.3716 Transcript_2361/m.3716 type:complete len:336 (-) Transcript_2361:203-1210(-)
MDKTLIFLLLIIVSSADAFLHNAIRHHIPHPSGTNGRILLSNAPSSISSKRLYSTPQNQPPTSEPAGMLRETLKGTCVFLVGMMGSGKSTLGDAFAKKLGYRFLDTDEIAEFMIEMPIAEFFEQGYEDEFRQLEYQILMQMAQYTRVVVATGGGIVVNNQNWGLLRHGIVVYLEMDPDRIVARLRLNPEELSKRPLLSVSDDPSQKLKDILAEREEKYKMADLSFEVPADKTPEETADLLIESMLKFIDDNPPMWQEWKKKRDQKAVDMAAMANPSAVMNDDAIRSAGNAAMDGTVDGEPQKKGSIQYVSLSDIQSGKVQLPNKNQDDKSATADE